MARTLTEGDRAKIAQVLYPDAKVKETFTISEQAQEAPKVKF